MSQNVTIVQIAQESGVSIATVSRVISGSAPVSAKTRQKVEAVIQKHRYNPNSVIQKITSVPYQVVAVVLPDIRNSYFSNLYMNIRVILEQAGFFVIMYNLKEHISDPSLQLKKEIEYLQSFTVQQISGVVILGGECLQKDKDPAYLAALSELARSTPVIVRAQEIPGVPAHFIAPFNTAGLILVLNYLCSQGHRRIGFLCGSVSSELIAAKVDVFRTMAAQIGYEYEPELIVPSGFDLSSSYYAAAQLLQLKNPVTAFIGISDTVTLGALRACTDYRKSVPKDISLISCYQTLDNDYVTPRLTSVDEHANEYSERLARILIAYIRGEKPPAYTEIFPKLMIRESSGPAPSIQ